MSTTEVKTTRSKELHERARRFLPAGVTGDGRLTLPFPVVFSRARGKWLYDVDGNEYLEYHGGFGTAVLGYAHPEVDAAVHRAIDEIGAFVGVPHVYEEELAERLCALIPLAERVAFCGGGGSDAIYHAVRLCRAVTGRTKILKLEGGYQGWHADVGVSTRPQLEDPARVGIAEPVPNSPGSLAAVTAEVLVVEANDEEALRTMFAQRGDEIAGMLVEPVIFSCGCVRLDPSYLQLARDLCSEHGALLVFDEIMTGFRSGIGGAGARLGVVADLGAFGKAIANGYIVSMLAGRGELMDQLTPGGPVFYSGTFNGHPLSIAAAQATLDVLERDRVPERLSELSERIEAGINEAIADLGVRAVCQSFGSIWNLYLNATSVRSYRDLARSLTPETMELNAAYLAFLRARLIYVHNRHVNRAFISAAHAEADIDRTVEVVREFLERHRKELAG
jgi:glutamate-1-semialdehyde 2,1-aminomutase